MPLAVVISVMILWCRATSVRIPTAVRALSDGSTPFRNQPRACALSMMIQWRAVVSSINEYVPGLSTAESRRRAGLPWPISPPTSVSFDVKTQASLRRDGAAFVEHIIQALVANGVHNARGTGIGCPARTRPRGHCPRRLVTLPMSLRPECGLRAWCCSTSTPTDLPSWLRRARDGCRWLVRDDDRERQIADGQHHRLLKTDVAGAEFDGFCLHVSGGLVVHQQVVQEQLGERRYPCVSVVRAARSFHSQAGEVRAPPSLRAHPCSRGAPSPIGPAQWTRSKPARTSP